MAWYDTSWLYRKKITVDKTKLTADVSNFPVYLKLDDFGANFWAAVKNGGGDIRITDSTGSTELAREIVTCNTATSKGELHFKATSISSSTNTDFYIYYGNSAASDYVVGATYGRNNVWTNSYLGVWHLSETPTNGATMASSTGSSDGVMTNGGSSAQAAAQLGNGVKFDGASYITLGTESTFDLTDNFTLSIWLKGTDTNWCGYIAKNGEGSGFILRTNASNYFNMKTDVDVVGTSNVLGGAWFYCVGTLGGGTQRVFVDGAEQNTGVNASTPVNNDNCLIGAHVRGGTYGGYTTATLDEARISNTERVVGWIYAEYNNQYSPSTFYALGSQESGAVAKRKIQIIILS